MLHREGVSAATLQTPTSYCRTFPRMVQTTALILQVVQPSVTTIDGRRRLLAACMGRKMLGEEELAGDGVSVGNVVVGEQANAYGHGDPGEPLPSLDNTHIQVRPIIVAIRIVAGTSCVSR